MNAENTLTQLKLWCLAQSKDEQIWTNKGTTYYWNRGKDTSTGLVNGVVRKLAGIDASGRQIWVVAGSFKIAGTGEILRFTGIPSKIQKTFEVQQTTVSVDVVNTPVLEPV
jgi:phosphoserine phosphatase